jgi:hypothetical protein
MMIGIVNSERLKYRALERLKSLPSKSPRCSSPAGSFRPSPIGWFVGDLGTAFWQDGIHSISMDILKAIRREAVIDYVLHTNVYSQDSRDVFT